MAQLGLLDEAFCTLFVIAIIIIILFLIINHYHNHYKSISTIITFTIHLFQVGTQHDQIVNVWDWKNNIKVMKANDDCDDGDDNDGGEDDNAVANDEITTSR